MPVPEWSTGSSPPREPSFRISLRRLGLYVLFASLGVLFVASLVGYLVSRADSANWRTPATPPPPAGLWLSTLLVFAISGALEGAKRAARTNQFTRLTRRLWLGLGFAVAFLLAQAHNWYVLGSATLSTPGPPLVVFGFFLLTGLHGAHVLGGLVPLSLVIARAGQREYSSSRHEGVSLCADYWHFLAVVWLVLFVVLETFA